MSKRPIGVIDSGVGGLTVAKELMAVLPNESIIYIGDDARCPYGPRTDEEVIAFTLEMIEALQALQVKLVVIACNTATAAALPIAQDRFPFPIVGVIEPGARTALQVSESNDILVLGTIGTVNSGAYQEAILRTTPSATVHSKACPKFVPVVESGRYHTAEAETVVFETMQEISYTNYDTVILGCTHYPLLASHIQKFVGKEVHVISSATETIVDVERLLRQMGLKNFEQQRTLRFFTTGPVEKFRAIVKDWLQLDNPRVEKINLQQTIHSKGRQTL